MYARRSGSLILLGAYTLGLVAGGTTLSYIAFKKSEFSELPSHVIHTKEALEMWNNDELFRGFACFLTPERVKQARDQEKQRIKEKLLESVNREKEKIREAKLMEILRNELKLDYVSGEKNNKSLEMLCMMIPELKDTKGNRPSFEGIKVVIEGDKCFEKKGVITLSNHYHATVKEWREFLKNLDFSKIRGDATRKQLAAEYEKDCILREEMIKYNELNSDCPPDPLSTKSQHHQYLEREDLEKGKLKRLLGFEEFYGTGYSKLLSQLENPSQSLTGVNRQTLEYLQHHPEIAGHVRVLSSESADLFSWLPKSYIKVLPDDANKFIETVREEILRLKSEEELFGLPETEWVERIKVIKKYNLNNVFFTRHMREYDFRFKHEENRVKELKRLNKYLEHLELNLKDLDLVFDHSYKVDEDGRLRISTRWNFENHEDTSRNERQRQYKIILTRY